MAVSLQEFDVDDVEATGCDWIVVDCEADVVVLGPRLNVRTCFSKLLISARTSSSVASLFSTESSMEERRTF